MGVSSSEHKKDYTNLEEQINQLKKENDEKHSSTYERINQLNKETDKKNESTCERINQLKRETDEKNESTCERINQLKKETDEKNESTCQRIKMLEDSHSLIASTLNGLTERLDEVGRNMKNSNIRGEECLEILQKETSKHLEHRLYVERMIHALGLPRTLSTPTATKDEWLGTVPKDILNTYVDETRILHIKACMSARHVKMIGRHLGLRDNDISEIEIDCKNQSAEVAYQILLKWKNRLGQQAKVKHLIACFFQAAMEDPSSVNVDALRRGLSMCVN